MTMDRGRDRNDRIDRCFVIYLLISAGWGKTLGVEVGTCGRGPVDRARDSSIRSHDVGRDEPRSIAGAVNRAPTTRHMMGCHVNSDRAIRAKVGRIGEGLSLPRFTPADSFPSLGASLLETNAFILDGAPST